MLKKFSIHHSKFASSVKSKLSTSRRFKSFIEALNHCLWRIYQNYINKLKNCEIGKYVTLSAILTAGALIETVKKQGFKFKMVPKIFTLLGEIIAKKQKPSFFLKPKTVQSFQKSNKLSPYPDLFFPEKFPKSPNKEFSKGLKAGFNF